MGRYRGPSCRLCRREGTKLFLKGEKCSSAKCPFEKRGYPPGEHGSESQTKLSGYAVHLREKQKVRHIYGILERQFRNYFEKAARMRGVTGENLLRLLECRLDNVVFRLGFAYSRAQARQLVRHRHFSVNEKPVDIPSYQVKAGDTITIREKSKEIEVVKNSLDQRGKQGLLPWLSLDSGKMVGKVLKMPSREDIPLPVKEQLIIELYSK
ncbi:MAG: 30S ribosomal protein S4 [Candidatus Edwardsbacteria bacterium]